jgi:amidase
VTILARIHFFPLRAEYLIGPGKQQEAMGEWTIAELHQKLADGELSARRLTELFLERIQRLDRDGPRINAVIELNPDALSIADGLDTERAAGGIRRPLHGIPLLVKDNIDTGDAMSTTAGSLALEGSRAGRDAFLVERLRAAGAVILGKTNLSEWANFRGLHSTSGWSSRGGLTRNPYALDRSACGSSSGSAAAVAANLCAAAVGTETDGSIVCPAQTCGVVGIKPTLGLVSRSGIIPIAHSQDTAGPMARTVADAAALLGAMAGVDSSDPAPRAGRDARGVPAAPSPDYTRFLDPKGLVGARLGVARGLFGTNARVTKLIEACLDAMRKAGATIIDAVALAPGKVLRDAEQEVLHFEFKADLNAYLSGRDPAPPVQSLEEVISFNSRNESRVMPWFGQELMVEAQGKGPLTSRSYLAARSRCLDLARRRGIDPVIRKHRLDAIVCPSGAPAWLVDLAGGDPNTADAESAVFAAVGGCPHITVPAGFIFGLPVGISFFGPGWSEAALIRIAFAFERLVTARRPPRFLETADLSVS